MASNNLKGLTIEIGGDTSNLQTALKGTNAEITNLQSNLRAVESALRLDPGNITALTQKQQLLTDAVAATTQKLETLREAQRQADEQMASGGEVDQVAYRNLQTEIARTEASLNNYTTQLSDARNELNQAGEKTDDLSDATDDLEGNLDDTTEATEDAATAAGKLSDGYSVVKNVIANLITDALQKLWGTLKDFGTDMIETAAEVNAEWSTFDQVFGSFADSAEASLNEVAATTGTVATRMLGTFNSLGARFKGLGADAQTGADLASRSLEVAADSAAFWDKSLEDASANLGSFLSGNYEAGESLGVFTSASQLATWAAQQFGIDIDKVSELEKQQIRLAYWESVNKSSGAMGQAARESTSWANVTGNLTEVWRQFQAKVGAPVLEALTPVIQDITTAFQDWVASVDWEAFGETVQSVFQKIYSAISGVITWIVTHGMEIKAVIAGIAAAWLVIKGYGIVQSIMSLISVMRSASGVMAALNAVMALNPAVAIALAIGALVAAFVVLYNKCEWFRDGVNAIWKAIKSGIQALWNAVKPVITAIANAFKAAVEAIKAAWAAVQPFFAAIWEGIKKIFAPVISVFTNLFKGAWTSIKAVWDAVVNYFKAVFDGITGVFKFIKAILSGDFKGAWEAIKEIWNAAGNFFKSVFDLITAPFKGIATFFTGIFSDAWNGIKNIFSSWKTFFSDRLNDIKSAFSGIVNVGKDLVSGLWNGIASKITWLKDKITGWCSGIMDTVKGWFGISSPSKVMRDVIGKQLPAGVGEGIVENADAALDPMSALKDDLTDMNGLTVNRNIAQAFGAPSGSSLSLSALEAKLDAMIELSGRLVENSKKGIYMDKNRLVGIIAPLIDEALGDIAARKAVGAL